MAALFSKLLLPIRSYLKTTTLQGCLPQSHIIDSPCPLLSTLSGSSPSRSFLKPATSDILTGDAEDWILYILSDKTNYYLILWYIISYLPSIHRGFHSDLPSRHWKRPRLQQDDCIISLQIMLGSVACHEKINSHLGPNETHITNRQYLIAPLTVWHTCQKPSTMPFWLRPRHHPWEGYWCYNPPPPCFSVCTPSVSEIK